MKFSAFVLVSVIALAACQTATAQIPSPAIPFDSRAFLPPPPAPDSAAGSAERAALRQTFSAERLEQARQDDVFDPFAAFDSVLGAAFRAERLPATAALLVRVGRSASGATGPAKDQYRRARPFIADPAQPTCIALTDSLRASHSYPSGHAAAGWAWALVLAELEPAHAEALLARGRDYGDSRIVCGLHWPSDVEAGRLAGAGAVARLHADGDFVTQMQAARAELDAVVSAPR